MPCQAQASACFQVPNRAEDEDEIQTVKKSKGTGGAAVGTWQEASSKSSRQQHNASPGGPAKPAAKKPKDAHLVEMSQYMQPYHIVPAQVSFEQAVFLIDDSNCETQENFYVGICNTLRPLHV